MTVALRAAVADDVPALLPRMSAFNAHEQIEVDDDALAAALGQLIASPELGAAWLVVDDGATIGYAIVSYGFDLEFAGRDAYLTELWIDPPARARGAARAALERLAEQLRAHEARALHLQVRPDNPAIRLYERAGFERSPRVCMTRRLT